MDALIGAATLAVALAALGTTAGVLYVLLILGALLGIGLVLEPKVTARPIGDTGAQSLESPTESSPRTMARGDAAIIDATSV